MMKWINHKAHTPFWTTTAGKDHRVNLCRVPGNQEAIPQGTDKFPGDLSDLLTCSRASPSLKSPFRFVPDNSSSQVNSSESVTSPNGLKSISHTFPCRTERKPSKDKIKTVSWLIRKMILFYPKSSHFILKIISLIWKGSSSRPHLWRAACLSRAGTEPQKSTWERREETGKESLTKTCMPTSAFNQFYIKNRSKQWKKILCFALKILKLFRCISWYMDYKE